MSQQLADLRQGCTGAQKLGGETVPEDLGSLVCIATDAGTFESGLGYHRDRACGGKADVGSTAAQEQSTA